jgi:hypothetical protein
LALNGLDRAKELSSFLVTPLAKGRIEKVEKPAALRAKRIRFQVANWPRKRVTRLARQPGVVQPIIDLHAGQPV